MRIHTIIFSTIIAVLSTSNAFSQVVFDPLNYTANNSIDTTSKSILTKNTEIRTDTENILKKATKISEDLAKTLEAITKPRTPDTTTQTAAQTTGDDDFTRMEKTIDALILYSDGIKQQYETRITKDNKSNKDPLVENVSRTTTDISSFVKGTLALLKIRKKNYIAMAQNIGQTKDIKDSIDQNSEIQAQNGLLLNELAGISNNMLASNQTDTRNRTTNLYRNMMTMGYNDN